MFKLRVRLTCALRAHVKQSKNDNFTLENIIYYFLRSWMHDFSYVYFFNNFFNICPSWHKLTFALN